MHSAMICNTIGLVRQLLWPSCCSRQAVLPSCNFASRLASLKSGNMHQSSSGEQRICCDLWRMHSLPVESEEQSLTLSLEDKPEDNENNVKESPEVLLYKPASSDELKVLLADAQRAKLVKKLSEANQHNRFLKRQLKLREDSLVNFKSELALLELEIQASITLAEEIANADIPGGSRKINGKYIHSHLLSRLQAVQKTLKEQIKDVEAAEPKEVSLFWMGMAESVQVMGSFDGWSQGEYLSAEYSGSFTNFSTTLLLRPGRYEIKFLVDGQWQLSPEFPIVGEGLMQNNLLIVA